MSVERPGITRLIPITCALAILGACAQSASPEKPESLASAIRPMVEKGPVQVKEVRLGDGTLLRRAQLGQGFQHVLIERTNADGTRDMACVDSVEQANQFVSQARSTESR